MIILQAFSIFLLVCQAIQLNGHLGQMEGQTFNNKTLELDTKILHQAKEEQLMVLLLEAMKKMIVYGDTCKMLVKTILTLLVMEVQ